MFVRMRQYLFPFLLKILVIVYRAFYLPIRVLLVRRKKVIKVAFVLSDLGKWKTELLYKAMRNHFRFEPVILVCPYLNNKNSGISVLISYLRKKDYHFFQVDRKKKITDIVRPDIIFYQEPYSGIIDENKFYKNNLSSLFCYVAYGYHWVENEWILNQPLLSFCWQIYYENSLATKSVPAHMTNKGRNCIVTGLPMTDLFQLPKSHYCNPWKKQDKSIYRIIWAPHYTILNGPAFCYSTFLTYCDYMLYIADKYKGCIQVAFKPHPILITKLYEIWGKEKADAYYNKWRNGDNTQLELGEYIGLFMYSDAMIHDCGTFIIEYHYTHNPVLYLLNGTDHYKDLNEFGAMAFDLHYKGRCKEDIETFINKVIEGRDEMKEAREKFYNDYLLPPDGYSATDNIIKAILGE